jgi:hypothetical protein
MSSLSVLLPLCLINVHLWCFELLIHTTTSPRKPPYFTTNVKKLFKVCVCPFKVVVNDKV